MLDNLLLFSRSITRVSARRLRRGPATPEWSAVYEAVIEIIRRGWDNDHDLAGRRSWMERVAKLAPPQPGVATKADELGGRPAEWQISEDDHSDAPVWLYLHGGAYEIGSPQTHRPLTAPLAKGMGGRVVALDYRLAPENPCPAGLDDAVAAFYELVERGIAPHRIAIGGDSAGGGLAAATLMALRDAGGPMPATGVLLSPWMDLHTAPPPAPLDYLSARRLGELGASYGGSLGVRDPRVSPIFGDFTGLPPILIVAGGAELILADSTGAAEKIRDAGGEVELHVEPNEVHVYPFFTRINPRARAAHTRMTDWVRRRTAS